MNDTTSFFVAFGAFWLGIAGYVAWLMWRAKALGEKGR